MKKSILALALVLLSAIVFSSCAKKSKVVEAAERIESLASDVEELANKLEATTDPEKLQSLMEKGKEIERKSKSIANDYEFISCSSNGELSVEGSLSEEKSEDRDRLNAAIDKLDKAYLKVLTKSVKEIQSTVESMGTGSASDIFGGDAMDALDQSSEEEE